MNEPPSDWILYISRILLFCALKDGWYNMAFSLYCLISNQESNLNISLLEDELREYFSRTSEFDLSYEEHPFDPTKQNILLTWDTWWIRVFFETGSMVEDDSREISKFAKTEDALAISSINRRVRVLFGNDDKQAYTNHIIWMQEYLESKPDLIVFDPQQNIFLSSSSA